MKKGSFLLKLCMLLFLLFSIIFYSGDELFPFDYSAEASTPGSMTIVFPEAVGSYQTKTVTIPNLYRVVNAVVNNGTVSTTTSGNQVTVRVNNGNYISYSSRWNPTMYSKYVTTSKSDSGTCPWATQCKTKEQSGMYSSVSYNQGGYSGTLYETSYSYNQSPPGGTKPAPAYYSWSRYQSLGGTVYAGGYEYYNYTYAYSVTLTYETNIKPNVTVTPGLDNKVLSDYQGYSSIDISGFVEDQDNDSVTVDVEVNGQKKSQVISNTNIAKPFSVIFDVNSDGLSNGINTVNIYANDGTGRFLVKSFSIKVTAFVEDGKYVLVDDLLFYLTKFTDPEGDPLYLEQFKYVQDETFFENDLGKIPDDNIWRNSTYSSLSKVGHFKIYYRAMDNPNPDPLFTEFRRWSEPSPALNLYVHRRPIANFDGYMNQYTGQVALIDKSYDLDKYSMGRNGIKTTEWAYREVGTTNWTNSRPFTLIASKNYEVKQTVWDFQGASATIVKPLSKVGTLPNVPPVPGFTHESPYYVGDTVKLTSTAYDDDGDRLTYRYVITKPDGSSTEYKAGDPELNEATGDLTFKVNDPQTDIGLWEIVQYVDDNVNSPSVFSDTIEVLELTIKGYVEHTPEWQQTHLEKGNLPNQFYSGEKFLLAADVTDYPIDKVEVEFTGQQINNSTLNLITPLSQNTSTRWNGELYQNSMSEPSTRLSNGSVDFLFKVYYSNGYVASDLVTVDIIGSALNVLKFHRKY